MKRIPDELLEYYAEIFIEHRIGDRGITFERFLEMPESYLRVSLSPGGDRR